MQMIARIIKSILVVGVVGIGLLFLSNALRSRWFFAGVDVVLALIVAALHYGLNRRPQLSRLVGVVLAVLLVGVPLIFLQAQPADMVGTIAALALGAVLILCILWPVVGLAFIGVETLLLLWLAVSTEYVTYHVPASFVMISFVAYLIARALLGALTQAESAQNDLAERNQELERTSQALGDTVEQQQFQLRTIRELETPLIESERGVGLLVVVGGCDVDRVQAIQENLFAGLQERSFRRLVIDISGARFDDAGFYAFTQTLQALRLMVSEIMISGMSTQLAADLVQDRERVRSLQHTVTFVHSLQEAFVEHSLW